MSLSRNHCLYVPTVQLTCTGDPSIGFIYLFQVQIAMNIQHPRLLAQARQNPSTSCSAQDDIQRQASSKHSRDKASSSDPCGKITMCCLCPFLRKNCHQLDNTPSWPHMAIAIKIKLLVTSLYLPYLSFGYVSVVTFHQPHGAQAADGPAPQPLPWPHYV